MRAGARVRVTPAGIVCLVTGRGHEFAPDTPPRLVVGDGGYPEHLPAIGAVRAVDVDSVAGGWLLASPEGVFQLDGAAPVRLSPPLEHPPVKVRRGPRSVWARVKQPGAHDVLMRVAPAGPVKRCELGTDTWSWEDFDANAHGTALLRRWAPPTPLDEVEAA